jgi:hypothetical protein
MYIAAKKVQDRAEKDKAAHAGVCIRAHGLPWHACPHDSEGSDDIGEDFVDDQLPTLIEMR